MHLPEWRGSFDKFLAAPAPWEFLLPWVRSSSCLPVYADWTHAFGVTEGGRILSYDHEQWPGVSGPPDGELLDVRLRNLALHQGVKRYRWLQTLVRPRPSDAQDCSICSGTGLVPVPDIVCYCGGAGWVPADDTWVNKERLALGAIRV